MRAHAIFLGLRFPACELNPNLALSPSLSLGLRSSVPCLHSPPADSIFETLNPNFNLAIALGGCYRSFEMIRRIYLATETLTTENGCLTPTLKIKRCVLRECWYQCASCIRLIPPSFL